ncbi:MAG: hypothetical protein ACP5PW_00965 [Candidatus Dormibacteria bacterium]
MWPSVAPALAALAAVLFVGGCGVGPSGSLQVRQRPTPSPTGDGLAANSFLIQGENLFGVLSARGTKVTCSAGGSSVRVSGEVQGKSVVVALSRLRPGQDLYDPPLEGGFSDSVTMTVSGLGGGSPTEYQAGFQDGNYQGVGTLKVGRSGRSGTVSIQFGPPVGQEPSVQSSGNTTTFGSNSGSVDGSWSCP